MQATSTFDGRYFDFPSSSATEPLSLFNTLSTNMPSAVRPRSPSPVRASKKVKPDATSSIQLPAGAERAALHESYNAETPYKHIVVPGLLSDELVSWVDYGGELLLTLSSSRRSSRRPPPMVFVERRAASPAGDGSLRRRTFTRCAQCHDYL